MVWELRRFGGEEDKLALISPLPVVQLTTDTTFMVFCNLCTSGGEVNAGFFSGKGQLFPPQNSKAHCIHLLFLVCASDHFSKLLKDVVKLKEVSS